MTRYGRQNKFNAVKTKYKGRTYDSKAEAQYAAELDLRQEAGSVMWWLRQPRFDLGEDERYAADFMVYEKKNILEDHPHAVDVKGKETTRFNKIKRLWRKYGIMPLHVVKKQGGKFVTVEVIERAQ